MHAVRPPTSLTSTSPGQVSGVGRRHEQADDALVAVVRDAAEPRAGLALQGGWNDDVAEDGLALRDVAAVGQLHERTRLRAVTSKVAVTTGEIAVNPYGTLEVPVSVRNDNTFPFEHVAVYVSLCGANDRLISIDTTSYNYTEPSTLAPGTFTADAFANIEGLRRVRLGVEAFRG